MDRYRKVYADLGFERAGLFEKVQKHFECVTALYPGSSFHITPSLFFPHVVYVDRCQDAVDFFADPGPIQAYIDRRKTYHRRAYFEFINADYTQPLPVKSESFDLLIELFAGRIAVTCARYLKPGGLLLTNQVRDIPPAPNLSGFRLVSEIQFHKGTYQINTRNNGRRSAQNPRYLKQSGEKLVYDEKETYLVYLRE